MRLGAGACIRAGGDSARLPSQRRLSRRDRTRARVVTSASTSSSTRLCTAARVVPAPSGTGIKKRWPSRETSKNSTPPGALNKACGGPPTRNVGWVSTATDMRVPVRREVEELLAVGSPDRAARRGAALRHHRAAAHRERRAGRGVGIERAHVDLVRARLVGRVREPAPVRRKARVGLVELRGHERDRFARLADSREIDGLDIRGARQRAREQREAPVRARSPTLRPGLLRETAALPRRPCSRRGDTTPHCRLVSRVKSTLDPSGDQTGCTSRCGIEREPIVHAARELEQVDVDVLRGGVARAPARRIARPATALGSDRFRALRPCSRRGRRDRTK